WDALAARAGGLVGDLVGHHAGVGLGPLLGHALAAGHVAGLGAGFVLVHAHLDLDGDLHAFALVAGDLALLGHDVRDPAADSLDAAAAIVAARLLAAVVLGLFAADNLAALEVALVHATINRGGVGLADHLGGHAFAFLVGGHAHAVGAGDGFDLGDRL